MLTIETFISRSKHHGMGIFTNQDLKKGQIIWVFSPLVDITYTREEWENLKDTLAFPSFQAIERYIYKENNLYILCTDNAQFMNHSTRQFNVQSSAVLNSMLATRDIQAGEELLCDYFEYSDSDDPHRLHLTSKEAYANINVDGRLKDVVEN